MKPTSYFEQRHNMTEENISAFCTFLRHEERSRSTISKYRHDVEAFFSQLPKEKLVDKETILAYKEVLIGKYAAVSVNSVLAAINQFLAFMGWSECKVKFLKIQRTNFREANKELTKEEYSRLLIAAKSRNNERLYLLMQAICSTGIRVSEHKFITVEAVKGGQIHVHNKGKDRTVLIPETLVKPLLKYCKLHGIESGPVFVTKSGRPMDRSNIWAAMKRLCAEARVDSSKVSPPHFRHLFSFAYYRLEKDIIRLADILGHSSVETTRIYTATNVQAQKKLLSRLGLVGCI